MIFLREETKEKISGKRKRNIPIRKEGFREVWFLKQNSFPVKLY